MKMNKNLETDIYGTKLIFRSSNCVEICYAAEFDINLETAQKIDQAISDHFGDKKFYLIVNLADTFGSMPNDVQHFFAKEANSIPQIIAAVYIINNLPIRILAKFYIRFFQPDYPATIVSTYAKSLEWMDDDMKKRDATKSA